MSINSGELSLLLTGLNLRTSVEIDSLKEAIRQIDARLTENEAR